MFLLRLQNENGQTAHLMGLEKFNKTQADRFSELFANSMIEGLGLPKNQSLRLVEVDSGQEVNVRITLQHSETHSDASPRNINPILDRLRKDSDYEFFAARLSGDRGTEIIGVTVESKHNVSMSGPAESKLLVSENDTKSYAVDIEAIPGLLKGLMSSSQSLTKLSANDAHNSNIPDELFGPMSEAQSFIKSASLNNLITAKALSDYQAFLRTTVANEGKISGLLKINNYAGRLLLEILQKAVAESGDSSSPQTQTPESSSPNKPLSVQAKKPSDAQAIDYDAIPDVIKGLVEACAIIRDLDDAEPFNPELQGKCINAMMAAQQVITAATEQGVLPADTNEELNKFRESITERSGDISITNLIRFSERLAELLFKLSQTQQSQSNRANYEPESEPNFVEETGSLNKEYCGDKNYFLVSDGGNFKGQLLCGVKNDDSCKVLIASLLAMLELSGFLKSKEKDVSIKVVEPEMLASASNNAQIVWNYKGSEDLTLPLEAFSKKGLLAALQYGILKAPSIDRNKPTAEGVQSRYHLFEHNFDFETSTKRDAKIIGEKTKSITKPATFSSPEGTKSKPIVSTSGRKEEYNDKSNVYLCFPRVELGLPAKGLLLPSDMPYATAADILSNFQGNMNSFTGTQWCYERSVFNTLGFAQNSWVHGAEIYEYIGSEQSRQNLISKEFQEAMQSTELLITSSSRTMKEGYNVGKFYRLRRYRPDTYFAKTKEPAVDSTVKPKTGILGKLFG